MNIHNNSLESFETIKPTLSKRQNEVYEVIKKYPGCTIKFYSQHILYKPLNVISGRFTELKRKQLIKEGKSVNGCSTYFLRTDTDELNKFKLTYKEKFERVGEALKWCKETKNYVKIDLKDFMNFYNEIKNS